MRAVVLDAPAEWVGRRREKGLDLWDEVWEGVLHVVPLPSPRHQKFESRLEEALRPLVTRRGLEIGHDIGLYRPETGEEDYRVPDLMVYLPELESERGVEGPPEWLAEIRSPNDESHLKLPFYESVGAKELLIVDPSTRIFDYFVRLRGRLRPVKRTRAEVRSRTLGIGFSTAPGPKLRLTWRGGSTSV